MSGSETVPLKLFLIYVLDIYVFVFENCLFSIFVSVQKGNKESWKLSLIKDLIIILTEIYKPFQERD